MISPETSIRVIVFLLYASVALIAFRWLLPRLSPTAKGLATVFLAAQIFVIGAALVIRPATEYERWILNLDQEWNVPTALASTQLALVGGVALLTSWLAKVKPALQRLYLIGIGLIFLFLARDEYERIHDVMRNWRIYYAAVGALVATATMVYASHQPRRKRIWDFCFLAGLAISATGAMGIEQLQYRGNCPGIGLWQGESQCPLYYVEESLEFLGIWLALLGMLGRFSEVSPRSGSLVRSLLFCLPVFWILPLIPSSLLPYLALRFPSPLVSIKYESQVELQALRLDYSDRAVDLQFLAQPSNWQNYSGLGYSLHLVDQVSGLSVASVDESASRQDSLSFRRLYPYSYVIYLYKQSMELEIPPQTPTNRALWVVLTLWRERNRGYFRQKVLESDRRLLDDTQVVLGEMVLPAESAASSISTLATFNNGFVLDAVDIPGHAQAGETLSIPFAWQSDTNEQEDQTQFLHFVHEESGIQWGHDQHPLGARLPTRLWYAGLADSEVWQVPLPADLAPGRYEVFTGLYRTRDLERVPVRDANGELWLDGRVSLGNLIVE